MLYDAGQLVAGGYARTEGAERIAVGHVAWFDLRRGRAAGVAVVVEWGVGEEG